jgi:hypothetical protein
MKRFDFWQTWLFCASIVIAVFGLAMALFSNTPLFAWMNNQIDPVFWSASVTDTTALMFRSWIYGVLGATVLGWGVTLAFIASYPFKKKERWSWQAIACGTASWYVLDTSFSVYFGVYFNAALNTVLLLSIALPLIMTHKEFKTKT